MFFLQKPIIFIEFTTILILVFLIRYLMLYTIEKNKNKKKSIGVLKNISLYIMFPIILKIVPSIKINARQTTILTIIFFDFIESPCI